VGAREVGDEDDKYDEDGAGTVGVGDDGAAGGRQPVRPTAMPSAITIAETRGPRVVGVRFILLATLIAGACTPLLRRRAFRIWTPDRPRLGAMRLLLIRHAQTIDNVRGSIGTVVPGPELTDLGREQAAALPDALAGENIRAIYASTMQRTALTAAPLAAALDIEVQLLDGLQEIAAGDLEGRSDKDSVRAYMRTIISWWHERGARMSGGESGDEFFARFTDAIAHVDGHDGTVAVFSHGAAIRTWASAISRNIDEAFSRQHELPNTAMIVLEGSPADGWTATHWDGEPVSGEALEDSTALDPLSEAKD
jgi:broad specificity phosphatase PhoE